MKKKRLNQHQLSRIQKKQDACVDRAGRQADKTDSDAITAGSEADEQVLGPERRGLVISHFGQQLDIEALEGSDAGCMYRCYQRSNLDALVAGDEVIWQQGEPLGVVVTGLPRRSLLSRPNNFGDLKPVAANIDMLVIVIAPLPEPHANLIDRYLVAAEHIGIQPLLLLNKLDMLDAGDGEALRDMLRMYQKIGYATLQVSAKSTTGLAVLKQSLAGRTSIFAGQSGVGKSALVNALLPGVNTLEGNLSEAVIKGRHTTTSARLFHFPDGGNLIDSPGIREFGLWHMEYTALLNGFVEFRPFVNKCRFRDCQHEREPGCQLLQAVAQGQIDPRRLASFQSIRTTLKAQ